MRSNTMVETPLPTPFYTPNATANANANPNATVLETFLLCLFVTGEQIRKLTYLQMLGYDMSWAAFYVIEVRFIVLILVPGDIYTIAWLFVPTRQQQQHTRGYNILLCTGISTSVQQ